MIEANARNLTALSKQVHEAAKAKGFWEGEQNTGQKFMLIISEVGEAMKAHRKGHFVNIEAFDKSCPISILDMVEQSGFCKSIFTVCFTNYIKDSFEDNLANILICVLDFVGSLDIVIDDFVPDIGELCGETNIGAMLFDACEYIVQAHVSVQYNSDDRNISERMQFVLRHVFAIAKYFNIDIARHIKLKLLYNKTIQTW